MNGTEMYRKSKHKFVLVCLKIIGIIFNCILSFCYQDKAVVKVCFVQKMFTVFY